MSTEYSSKSLSKSANKLIIGYNNIRTWATLLVIAGHSTALAIGDVRVINPYANLPGLYIAKVTEMIRELIYGFHMSLFVMLSGAVFVSSFQKTNLKAWIRKRVRRLLVPYFVVACLMWEPARLLIGYYSGISDLLSNFVKDVVMAMDINYLWYVMMLFEVGVVMASIYTYIWPKTVKGHFLLFCILWFISMIQNLMPELPFQLNRFMKYIFWFYMGMLFEKYREDLLARFQSTHRLLLLLVIAYFACFASWHGLKNIITVGTQTGIMLFGIKIVKMGLDYMAAGFGCLFFIILAFAAPGKRQFVSEIIGQRSFQIYLYHVPCCNLFVWGIQMHIPVCAMTNSIFATTIIAKFFVGLFGAFGIDCLFQWGKKQLCRERVKSPSGCQ
jgi:fucose 4-O-acetylase-like acetyltransferase